MTTLYDDIRKAMQQNKGKFRPDIGTTRNKYALLPDDPQSPFAGIMASFHATNMADEMLPQMLVDGVAAAFKMGDGKPEHKHRQRLFAFNKACYDHPLLVAHIVSAHLESATHSLSDAMHAIAASALRTETGDGETLADMMEKFFEQERAAHPEETDEETARRIGDNPEYLKQMLEMMRTGAGREVLQEKVGKVYAKMQATVLGTAASIANCVLEMAQVWEEVFERHTSTMQTALNEFAQRVDDDD